MRAFEIVLSENYRYAGSGTGDDTSALEKMMASAKQVSYATFVRVVGMDALRALFNNFAWGHQRDNVRMKNDPNVTYFKSTFAGKPCYYVRESGVEHIFVDDDKDPEDVSVKAVRFSIMPDGGLVKGPGTRPTFHGIREPGRLLIIKDAEPTAASAATLVKLIRASGVESVVFDDELKPAADTIRWLKKVR